MKKVLAVFMAVLMVFTGISVAFAETTAAPDSEPSESEKTTRSIVNDEGLVVPLNFKQLKMSVIFKIFEKIIKFILNLFSGDDEEGSLDESLADVVSSIADDVSNAIEEGSQFIEANTGNAA